MIIVHPEAAPILGAIATLGPPGTSSEVAARYLARRMGHNGEVSVRLYVSYEDACDAVLHGDATRLLAANAYHDIDAFYMDLRLDLEQAFVLDTPNYGLAVRSDTPLPMTCRVCTHPAPRALIKQLMPVGYGIADVEFAPSTSAAAQQAATGAADLALTTEPAAEIHGLRFISPRRPIRMLWSVFTRRRPSTSQHARR